MTLRKKTRKRKRKVTDECKYFKADLFGHPYCTAEVDKGTKCKYFVFSQEYVEMRKQLSMQKTKMLGNFGLSIYKCNKYDEFADDLGHLPTRFRPKPQKGFSAVTGKFN